jgi:hypothetical protein
MLLQHVGFELSPGVSIRGCIDVVCVGDTSIRVAGKIQVAGNNSHACTFQTDLTTTASGFKGCYGTSYSGMSFRFDNGNTNSPSKCAQQCAALQYPYSGTERG